MSGIQLVERLKRINGHVPMIVLGDAQAMNGQIHTADAMLARKTAPPWSCWSALR